MSAVAAALGIAAGKPVFLPYQVIPNWLPLEVADGLLEYAIANQHRFTDGQIYHSGEPKVDPALRKTRVLHDLGGYSPVIRRAARAAQPQIEHALKVSPFEAQRFEIELAAHVDGAHFDRHIDTFVGSYRQTSSRVLTLVYYLLREPKAFTGGALRMYGLGGPTQDHPDVRDIEPRHNQLVAFPSIAPHSVTEVRCPGDGFALSRFAVNIWIHRQEGSK